MSCTSALRALKALLDGDEIASPDSDRIFTRAGLEDIDSLALKCQLIYRAAILTIQKAADRKKSNVPADNNERDSTEDEKTTSEVGSLVGPLPNLSSRRTLRLFPMLRDQSWEDWLDKRLEVCTGQLFWIASRLLVHLQIGKLAELYV